MDFDETRLYYSHQQLQTSRDGEQVNEHDGDAALVPSEDDGDIDLHAVRRHFREFLRNYRLDRQRYVYRESLLRMHRRCLQSAIDASEAQAQADAAANANNARLELDIAHLGEYDAGLLGFLIRQPAKILPALEKGANDALESLLYDQKRRNRDEENQDNHLLEDQERNQATESADMADSSSIEELLKGIAIQILIKGNLRPTNLRNIKSEHINRLIKCPGIVISNSPVKNRAVQLKVRCTKCDSEKIVFASEGPFGSVTLPASCPGDAASGCGSFPFAVVPDESKFVDQQTLKLQEAPERVPTGEMPRSVLMAVERSLVDVAPPGTRVAVFCIPTMFTAGGLGNKKAASKSVYLRVIGMTRENDAHGQSVAFTPSEEEAFRALSRRPDVYEILCRSIAPNISGSYTVDIKKALACQLFSGSHKKLPDGVRLRGDINVLLLGDPSMAKSQFLKFVSKVAPIGIYTSGKGSSAAGLTASVVRNAKGEFYLEGGAMVLADGGVVCIDEFDKMRPADRVAIHEAMEQQTISVAKAGITTVLNSRSSVLAAANPVFGRYDDFKSASENIDLMTTILSRFDLIFLVRDIREEERDRMICQHVMGVHMHSSAIGGDKPISANDLLGERLDAVDSGFAESPEAIVANISKIATTGQGELEVSAMKKYIQYAKAKCSPRLSEEAGQVLTSSYVKIRDDVRRQAIQSSMGGDGTQASIPITVRQLEALIRLSESLAKMRLDPNVQPHDVTEAIRLFKVSTMAANAVDQHRAETTLASITAPNRTEMERTESFLRLRLQVGSLVNKQKLIEEAAGQGFNAILVARALAIMASRGDLLERNQGRLIKRLR